MFFEVHRSQTAISPLPPLIELVTTVIPPPVLDAQLVKVPIRCVPYAKELATFFQRLTVQTLAYRESVLR